MISFDLMILTINFRTWLFVERAKGRARQIRIEKLKVERDLERLDKIWFVRNLFLLSDFVRHILCRILQKYFITLDDAEGRPVSANFVQEHNL